MEIRRQQTVADSSQFALLLLCIMVSVESASGFDLPGSKKAPVHLGGGFKIENMDAFAMTVGALVLSVIR